MIIHFEDHGQDFLQWELAKPIGGDALVIDCKPFQGSHWIGGTVDVETIQVGIPPDYTTKYGEMITLRYPIESIETNPTKS